MNDYYAVVRSGAEDTLEHFGVVGMRWGIRHDRRVRMAKASYKTQRKALKKSGAINTASGQRKLAASREQWMKQRENAANRLYSLNSKGLNKKLARDSVAKTAAKTFLFGSKGAALYNDQSSRSKGKGRLRGAAAATALGAAERLPFVGLGTEAASLGYYVANRKRRKR